MNALVALNAGRLDEAVQLALGAVRAAPGDAAARFVLAELLCFNGDFERADGHLDTASTLDPSCGLAVAQFRQLIRAEVARQDCFAAGRPPEWFLQPSAELRERLAGLVALRAGEDAGAAAALGRAEEQRKVLHGTCNGAAFDDLRDADDLTASVVEVLAADGRYFWLPMECVKSLRFEKPARARDLLFRQAHLEGRGVPDGEVFVPVLYAGSHKSPREEIRLGRATDWIGDAGPVRGIGQRVLLAGDADPALLQIDELVIAD